jgi:hypothetical protein
MNNQKKKIARKAVHAVGETLFVLGVFVLLYLLCTMVSCKVTADGIEIISGDFTAPELLSFLSESAEEILIGFSEKVRLTGVHITSAADGALYAKAEQTEGESSAVQRIVLSQKTQTGEHYRLTGVVEDVKGNTLSFSVGFSGYNERVPVLILSEVRTEYSNPKAEFIELYAVTAGDLAGVTVYSAYDGVECVYEFSSCEVAAGEYIVLHYRKLTDDCIDETGTNLLLSGGTDASAARDFWVNNTAARIVKSDVILLRKRSGGALLDALLYSESGKTDWKNDVLRKAAEEAHASGLWSAGSAVENALNSDKVTATRTIGRQNIPTIAAAKTYSGTENGRSAWAVTATSSASPGKLNSTTPFQ